jgi:3-hydroxyisobutyrate dehydrogenase-like beta-hydroxyacid dehydrogenase
MTIKTVGLISTGDMGSGIGIVLKRGGLDVATCTEGRSELTKRLAREAGLRDTASLDELIAQANIMVSVLVPSQARNLADRVAESMRRTGKTPVYVDCNAVSPRTVRGIRDVIEAAGARFVDCGIMGGPPQNDPGATFFCSGPDTTPMDVLASAGLNVRRLGSEIGQASGLKMVFSASTKGTIALWSELLTAATALGLRDELLRFYSEKNTQVAAAMIKAIPGIPWRAHRYAGEMEEVAATFEETGLTPRMLQGAAEMYELMAATEMGKLTSRDPYPELADLLDAMARQLRAKQGTAV